MPGPHPPPDRRRARVNEDEAAYSASVRAAGIAAAPSGLCQRAGHCTSNRGDDAASGADPSRHTDMGRHDDLPAPSTRQAAALGPTYTSLLRRTHIHANAVPAPYRASTTSRRSTLGDHQRPRHTLWRRRKTAGSGLVSGNARGHCLDEMARTSTPLPGPCGTRSNPSSSTNARDVSA